MNQRNIQSNSGLGTANPLCVSSILTRASIPSCKELAGDVNKIHKSSVEQFDSLVYRFGTVDIPVTISDNGKYVSLRFTYKGNSRSHRLHCPLSEVTGSDIETVVKNFCREVDGLINLSTLLDFYLEHGTGSETTRKKNVANFKHYCLQDDISLDESIKILAQTDELGRTLPERWEALFNRPHKLRQVRSIFGRKNLLLFKREGWDTKVFGTLFLSSQKLQYPSLFLLQMQRLSTLLISLTGPKKITRVLRYLSAGIWLRIKTIRDLPSKA